MAETLLAQSQPIKRLIADRGYDANALRKRLRETGAKPVIPGRSSRKRPIQYDERRYRDRWRLEAAAPWASDPWKPSCHSQGRKVKRTA